MKICNLFILFILTHAVTAAGSVKEILIDPTFKSQEIYNGLTERTPPLHKDVTLDLLFKNSTLQQQQLYISIINPNIDKIIIRDKGDTAILGDLIPFTHRIFKHINHVYPVLLQPNESRKIDIKVLKQWQTINFRVVISSENSFIKTTNHDNFFIGIFYGILFIYLLLLICFYIFSKSNFFILYLSINMFMVLLFMQSSGTGYQFIWFYSATIQKYITVFAVLGYLTAHISFIRTFFSIRFKNIFSGFIFKILVYTIVFFGIIFLIQIYNRSYGYLHTEVVYYLIIGLFLTYGSIVTGLCIYAYMESRRREVIWVLIGMLFHLANWVIYINNEFGILRPLNIADNFKLFPSNIFIPQLNYYITMLEMFIVSVFIAINYHNLIRQNNLSTRRLEYLQKRNINTFVLGQEAEREKISAGIGSVVSNDILHLRDSLLSFDNRNSEEKIISSVRADIDKTLEDIQNITNNYVAPDMEKMNLQELITTATDKLFSEINLLYEFNRIPETLQLSAVANINLYRILQEISNNILKHAKASNVVISAIKDGKTLQIKISDDGVGFSDKAPGTKGIGLMNIESRINSLNGNFYVLSNEKTGSALHLIMPLKDIT